LLAFPFLELFLLLLLLLESDWVVVLVASPLDLEALALATGVAAVEFDDVGLEV
jgi:hypothetical protein